MASYEKVSSVDVDEKWQASVDIPPTYPARQNSQYRNRLRWGFLVGSIVLNICFVLGIIPVPTTAQSKDVTSYLHLARDVDRPFGLDHMKPDAAEEEEIWTTGSEYERGIIALSDSEVEDMGLPYAQRFPWDFTKGIYLLNGYHNLHCVRTIRNSLMEFKQGVPQSRSWEHLVHCLHTLRDDVICNADDTPRYSGFQPPRSSGLGQDRKCRDWKKLEAFANEHNSCFKHVDPANDTFRAIDRYRYCPEGSPYKHDAETKWLPPNWSREDSGEI